MQTHSNARRYVAESSKRKRRYAGHPQNKHIKFSRVKKKDNSNNTNIFRCKINETTKRFCARITRSIGIDVYRIDRTSPMKLQRINRKI